MPAIRVILADDHRMFRQGLRGLLEAEEGIEPVGEAETGEGLALLAEHLEADVAVIDVSMPGPGPAAIARALPEGCRALALTMHHEPSYARELMAAGLLGYVVKDAAFDELSAAIRTVAAGEPYLCRMLTPRPGDEAEGPLTARERECLTAAAAGKTAKMIAREMGCTERTVRFHVGNICRKLGVARRGEAVAEALRLGLISV